MIALDARGVMPFGNEHTAFFGSVSRLAVVAGYIGLALGAAVIVAGSLLGSWRAPVATRVVVGLIGAGAAGNIVTAADDVRATNAAYDPSGAVPYPHAHAGLVHALGWAGLLIAIAAAVVPQRWARRARTVLTMAATLPFLASATAYVVAGAAPNLVLRQPRSLQSGIAQGLLATVSEIAMPVLLVGVWQAVEGMRASRDIGYGIARKAERQGGVLPVLVIAKASFVVLGLAGILPHVLGGGSPVWAHSRRDGVVSWLIAAAAGGAVLWWLVRRRHGAATTRGLSVTILGVTGLMFLFFILGTLMLELMDATAPFSSWFVRRVAAVPSWLSDNGLHEMYAAVFAVGGAGAIVLRRRTSLGVFLLVFCGWAAPRAIHGLAGDRDTTGVVDFVSLDAAVTAAVVVAWVVLSRRGLRSRRPELLIALVVGTAVGYAGFVSSLLPSAVSKEWFWITLALPLGYQLLFDAREVNESGERRPTQLLALVGFATILLANEVVLVSNGELNVHTTTGGGNLAQALFGVPLAALLVAAATTEEELETAPDETPAVPPAPAGAPASNEPEIGHTEKPRKKTKAKDKKHKRKKPR